MKSIDPRRGFIAFACRRSCHVSPINSRTWSHAAQWAVWQCSSAGMQNKGSGLRVRCVIIALFVQRGRRSAQHDGERAGYDGAGSARDGTYAPTPAPISKHFELDNTPRGCPPYCCHYFFDPHYPRSRFFHHQTAGRGECIYSSCSALLLRVCPRRRSRCRCRRAPSSSKVRAELAVLPMLPGLYRARLRRSARETRRRRKTMRQAGTHKPCHCHSLFEPEFSQPPTHLSRPRPTDLARVCATHDGERLCLPRSPRRSSRVPLTSRSEFVSSSDQTLIHRPLEYTISKRPFNHAVHTYVERFIKVPLKE